LLRFISAPSRRVAILWLATIAVHLWLIYEAQLNPQTAPFNDVNLYGYWADQFSAGKLLGINTPWVYPFVAMAPIYLAKLIGGPAGILSGWLILIGLLNAIGLSALVDWGIEGKRAFRAAGFYLAFLALMGPVAIGRIDSAATFFAILGLVQLNRDRIKLAMTFFTFGAWIKIWPVAAAMSAFSAFKSRLKSFLVAVATSIALLLIGLILGGNKDLFSFITMQGGRGLQIESSIATIWVWAAVFKLPGAGIYFDSQLVTNQVRGAFTSEVSTLMSLVMVAALAITAWLGFRAHKAGAKPKHLFAIMSLTATLDLIVFNKVGSPQFEGWLAVPIMAGILFGVSRWRAATVMALAIGLLTNLLYPIFYSDLTMLGPVGVGLLTARNLLLIALLVWANIRLTRLATE
jgi:hypothetical protein